MAFNDLTARGRRAGTVLVAMFAERESHAVCFLQAQDMTWFDAVNYISHGIAKAPGSRREQIEAPWPPVIATTKS